jgi:O-6-methylguanine DNA methyltransferase
MKSFADRVGRIVAGIPRGKVATYGWVAQKAGSPGAARAVGAIMRTNKDTVAVPCHRVVGAGGTLTGYSYGKGVESKKERLLQEGVLFKGDRVDLEVSGV